MQTSMYWIKLIAENIKDLKSSSFPLLDQVSGLIIRHKNKKLFAYENEPTLGTCSEIFNDLRQNYNFIFSYFFIIDNEQFDNLRIKFYIVQI